MAIQEMQNFPGQGRKIEIRDGVRGGAAVGGEVRSQHLIVAGQRAQVFPPGKARGPQTVEQHQGKPPARLAAKPFPGHVFSK
jgi:hypothetical protein